ncbi:MAG: hypothetical protein PWP65_2136 [Clostridia bacterium]|nr:hypothetical protein [Clostridia bacterium]
MFELRVNQDSIDEFLQHAGRDWSQVSHEEKRYYLRAKRQSEEKGDILKSFSDIIAHLEVLRFEVEAMTALCNWQLKALNEELTNCGPGLAAYKEDLMPTQNQIY